MIDKKLIKLYAIIIISIGLIISIVVSLVDFEAIVDKAEAEVKEKIEEAQEEVKQNIEKEVDKVDKNQLLRKAKANRNGLIHCTNKEQYLIMLEKLYNYRQSNKISFLYG